MNRDAADMVGRLIKQRFGYASEFVDEGRNVRHLMVHDTEQGDQALVTTHDVYWYLFKDAPRWRDGRFFLDGTPEDYYPGKTTGELWNGFATPWFTYQMAWRVIDTCRRRAREDDREDHGGYSASRDAFWYRAQDMNGYPIDDYTWGKPQVIDGIKYYPVGTFAWCWMEAS